MTNLVDSQTWVRLMAGNRGTQTKPKLALRRSARAIGLRSWLHAKGVLTMPDGQVIFSGSKAAPSA
jgi:DNA mismatch endonuclease (patch repair protein)